MRAHGDVSRQRDPGIQELSWDVPKLHSLRKEDPSASGKTPDLKNRRPRYRITEMRIQLPYHSELFNIARYVPDKAMVDAGIGKSVSKTQLCKMQEVPPIVLSSSFSYSIVSLSAHKAMPLMHVLLCRGRDCCRAAQQRGCRGHGGFCPALAHLPRGLCPQTCGAELSQPRYSKYVGLYQPCTLLG